MNVKLKYRFFNPYLYPDLPSWTSRYPPNRISRFETGRGKAQTGRTRHDTWREQQKNWRSTAQTCKSSRLIYFLFYYYFVLFFFTFVNRPKSVWLWWNSREKWRRIARECNESTRNGCAMSSNWFWARRTQGLNYLFLSANNNLCLIEIIYVLSRSQLVKTLKLKHASSSYCSIRLFFSLSCCFDTKWLYH